MTVIGKITIDYDNKRVYLFDEAALLIRVGEGDPPESHSISFDKLPPLLSFYVNVVKMRLQELVK